MEATFFIANRDEATGIHSWTDLPCDPAAEPLRLGSLRALRALASALGLAEEGTLTQLTDSTCRSFPVWMIGGELSGALRQLSAEGIEGVAARWRRSCEAEDLDADLYELECLLADLRDAVAAARPRRLGEAPTLFVLLEQKAF